MEHLLERLILTTQEAGKEATKLQHLGLSVTYKADGSPLTNADLAIENFIKDRLQKHGYSFRFGGEEAGSGEGESADFDVLVDGIDGTRNYRDGNYGWCTSVAVIIKGQTELAVINDAYSNATYYARRGGGAFVRTGHETRPLRALNNLPNDFSFSVGSFRIAGSKEVKRHIIEDIKGLGGREREWGCVGLSVCAVARGGLGVFIQYNSPGHDHLGAILIAQEAGVEVILSRQGTLGRSNVIVCHSTLNEKIIKIINLRTAGLDNVND